MLLTAWGGHHAGVPNLTRVEALTRSRLLAVDRYEIDVDLRAAETVRCRTLVRFDCTTPGAGTFAELTATRVHEVVLNGRRLSPGVVDDGRIRLDDLAARNELVVDADLPYSSTGEGIHRVVDPADGAAYAGAYIGVDVAQQVFACFDQPDLKATVSLTLRLPDGWTAVANGRVAGVDGARWSFAPTVRMSPHLVAFFAGPLHSRTAEHRGLPLGLHCRASLADVLDRDAEELFTITRSCLDHYAGQFAEPFPYDSYDQAFVPGLNWGALENPGCVTFRDELLPRDRTTSRERLRRAIVIGHEMAHMWFGDLVTMAWWDDIWLSESFAEYMGVRVVAEATGFGREAWADFAVSTKAWGTDADQRPSSHPVAPPADAVADTAAALANFDGISYAKGASALQQLVAWVGGAAFGAGVDAFLSQHRFGSATASSLYAALGEASGRDVAGWARVWLGTTGLDTLRVADGGLRRDGTRPHRLSVAGFDIDGRALGRCDVTVDGPSTPLALDAPVLLPNDADTTFAKLRPDETSWAALTSRLADLPDPVTRAVVWTTARDLVRDGAAPPVSYLALVRDQLPRERSVTLAASVVHVARDEVADQWVRPEARPAALDGVAAAGRALMGTGSDDLALVGLRAAIGAAGADGVAGLRGWLDADAADGVPLDDDLRWRVLLRLCVLGAADSADIGRQASRDTSALGAEHAARCRAALPDPAGKHDAWAQVRDGELAARMLAAVGGGLWWPEQRELVHELVTDYFRACVEIASRRGPAVADVLAGAAFPLALVSDATVEALSAALVRDDVPPQLHRRFSDRLDDWRRALRVQAG